MTDRQRIETLVTALKIRPMHKKELFGLLGFTDAPSFNRWIYSIKVKVELQQYGIMTTGDGCWKMNSPSQNAPQTIPDLLSFQPAPSSPDHSLASSLHGLATLSVADPVRGAPQAAAPTRQARPVPSFHGSSSSSASSPFTSSASVASSSAAAPRPAVPQQGGIRRHAFMIGNSDHAASFTHPQQDDPPQRRRGLTDVSGSADARLLFETLRDSFGFEGDFAGDLPMQFISENVTRFWDVIGDQDTALLYFSGHAEHICSLDGRSSLYLYGTDGNAYSLDSVLIRQARRNGVLIIILDCSSPNKNHAARSPLSITLPRNTFLVYSSVDSKEMPTGTGWERMSPYTENLREVLKALHDGQTSMSIEEVAKRVRKIIFEHSLGIILPSDASTLLDDFFF